MARLSGGSLLYLVTLCAIPATKTSLLEPAVGIGKRAQSAAFSLSCIVFSVGTVRTVFYARSGDIPLPRRDRLALLANHVLRRAVRTLSRGFWLSVPDGSEWHELAGGHGEGAHRVPTRSAPSPWRLARTAEL